MIKDYSDTIDGWFDFENVYLKAFNSVENGHFVEVGSWLGKSSVFMACLIANSGKDIKFDCVDTWLPGSALKGYPEIEKPFNVFKKNIKPVKNYINPVMAFSTEAAKNYEDNTLDFVFIDASHDYRNVCADIEAWYPKVRNCGIIAGHDYNWFEVAMAVNEKLTGFKIIGNSWYYEKPKIYDCFTFFNENDLLEIRLNELKDTVDEFVIVEASETFSGNKKTFNFDKERFKDFNIKYIQVDLPKGSAWEHETYQRNAILNGLHDALPTDYVIISDVDEIPSKEAIKQFAGDAGRLLMNQYRWKFNNYEFEWDKAIITRKNLMESPQVARIKQAAPIINDGGWHFTCISDVDGILLKFNSFSHTEMQFATKEYIEKVLKDNNSDGLNRTTLTPVMLDKSFPEYLLKNKDKFKKFIV